MGCIETLKHLFQDANYLGLRNGAKIFQHVSQCSAGHVLHHQIRRAAIATLVEDVYEVWVVEIRSQHGFTLEALQKTGILGKVRVNDFDRHLALKAQIFGQENFGHTPGCEWANDSVALAEHSIVEGGLVHH